MKTQLCMEPIGVIHTPFKEKDDCPIQGVYAQGTQGRVEIFKEHEAGLYDVEGFSHLYLFYYFDRAGEVKYVRPTFLDDKEHGIYASRHPCRPNGIGMTIVRQLAREENILVVDGIDVLEGTPLLDIKPYVRRFDLKENAKEGWFANVGYREKPKNFE